jgi:hypothetical protein
VSEEGLSWIPHKVGVDASFVRGKSSNAMYARNIIKEEFIQPGCGRQRANLSHTIASAGGYPAQFLVSEAFTRYAN